MSDGSPSQAPSSPTPSQSGGIAVDAPTIQQLAGVRQDPDALAQFLGIKVGDDDGGDGADGSST